MIVSNQIKCNKCDDEIFSMHQHHFVTCKCGAVSVDGGDAYRRRVGAPRDYQDMSITMDDAVIKRIAQKVEYSMDSGRNPLGVTMAVLRAIRDEGLKVEVTDCGVTNWNSEEKDKEKSRR